MKKKNPFAVGLGRCNLGVPKTITEAALEQRRIAAISSAKIRSERARKKRILIGKNSRREK